MKTIFQPLNDFISLFYPRICSACLQVLNQDEKDLCLYCKLSLPKTNFHEIDENPIQKLFGGRMKVEFATAYYYFTKKGKVQNLLHNIKYNGLKDLAVSIGLWFGSELVSSNYFNTVSTIVPVPLHKKKLKIRGYNQSEYFGIGLSKSMKRELSTDNLIRTIHTGTQTKKNRFQRWENVSKNFHVQYPDKFSGKHILLIDDVITTGSTLEACYLALKQCDNIKISIASIAFASN